MSLHSNAYLSLAQFLIGDISVHNTAERLVGKILKKRFNNEGVLQYLIEWGDSPLSANSWEPLSHLTYCQEAVAAYERSLEVKYPSSGWITEMAVVEVLAPARCILPTLPPEILLEILCSFDSCFELPNVLKASVDFRTIYKASKGRVLKRVSASAVRGAYWAWGS